ncbi:ShlB/FhaC/HecB family hemolysin secretion/activation protein [Pseudomonas aeruginosa]|nr:ShlB/FhaC/HecB family hemolysin secretion/activation protein [Pseudomonas aeruginosa]
MLFSPQRISLGGNSSVRGFKDQTLTGDSGGYWRNQLRWRRAVEWAPLQPGCRNTAWPSHDIGVIAATATTTAPAGMSGNAIELDAPRPPLRRQRRLRPLAGAAGAIERREHPIYFGRRVH